MSPIKSENRYRYPSNWKMIRAQIMKRSGGQCECHGECGKHNETTGQRRCKERDQQPALFARGRIILTIAHLDHTPENCDPENLKAMCQACHLRYDKDEHAKNAAATRESKSPQLKLF